MLRPRLPETTCKGFTVRALDGGSREHDQAEFALSRAGVLLPLPHRAAPARWRPAAASWFLRLTDGAGTLAGGITVEAERSRALPGQLLLRVPKFGPSLRDDAIPVCAGALQRLCRCDKRVLRLDVEVFEADDDRRALLGSALREVGFRRVPLGRTYSTTLALDLPASDEQHLASLSRRTRRDVRAADKHGLIVRPILEDCWAPRMDDLVREAMGRTGGFHAREDWRWKIGLSREAPGLSRLAGLFRGLNTKPDGLLAFAWGCFHGDHAEYKASGSCRSPDLKVPLSYALLWDLMCWARANGARWFDLGGVPAESSDCTASVEGITSFKRHFGDTLIRVGEGWVFEPSAVRAGAARIVRRFGRAWGSFSS